MLAQQIIVCDDEPHIIRAISLKLTRAGFDVKGATDIESCWRLLHRSEGPAMLITDYSMQTGSGGLELVRRVRADVQLADLPIIMLTANSADLVGQLESLEELGVAKIVTKPFSPRELLATVSGLVGHRTETHAVACGS